MRITNRYQVRLRGFTIVELLVVIVVIGILAAVTMVTYTGVTQKAKAISLQADVQNGSKKIKLFYVSKDLYPVRIDDCPDPGVDNICLQPTPGNVFTYSVHNEINPPTFELTATDTVSGTAYYITQDLQPTVVAPVTNPYKISAGGYHTCDINSNNNMYCWGANGFGELGDNTYTQRQIPTAVNTAGVLSGKTIKAVTVNGYYTCAIASDDKAYCWGVNQFGGLGDNSTTSSKLPVAVNTAGVLSGKTVKAISTGSYHTCAIASDDKAYCWGANSSGQLGNSSTTQSTVPVTVNTAGVLSGKTVKAISNGEAQSCVIASDDNAYCWGTGMNGALGNSSTTQSTVPVAVNTAGVLSGKTIKTISASGRHACVIASDDKAYCWGRNTNGQLGNSSTTQSTVPVAVNTAGVLSGKTIESIEAGDSHTCAIASDDMLYCWGSNTNGQLGNSSTTQSTVPVAVNTAGVLSGKTAKVVSAGTSHTCTIASDDKLYCWGWNNYGELGNNLTTQSTVPVTVSSH